MVIFTVLVRKVGDKVILLEKIKSRADHVCSTTDLEKQPILFCIVSTKKKKGELLTCPLHLVPFKLHEQKGDLLAQMLHVLILSVKLTRCLFCNIYLRFIIKMKTWFHTKNR